MRELTLADATETLIGSRLYCTRERAFYPVVEVTSVQPWPPSETRAPRMVFVGFSTETMPGGEFLMELAAHPNTRILVDSSGSYWQILDPGEEPPN